PPPQGCRQTAGTGQSRRGYVQPPAAKTRRRTRAHAPASCTSSNWRRSAFFSSGRLGNDLEVGGQGNQLFPPRGVSSVRLGIEEDKAHQGYRGRLVQHGNDSTHGDSRGQIHRIAVGPGGDRRKAYTHAAFQVSLFE